MDTSTYSDRVKGMTWVLVGIFGVLLGQLWMSWHTLHAYDTEEVEEEPAWECGICGARIYSTTIEGMLEGLRIHEEVIYCPGDEDDPLS